MCYLPQSRGSKEGFEAIGFKEEYKGGPGMWDYTLQMAQGSPLHLCHYCSPGF